MLPVDFHGIDIVRGRDCTLFVKGDTHAFPLDPTLLAGGWVGGQGVTWTSSTSGLPTLGYSQGLYGGILIWGSDEQGDRYTALTGQQLKYGYGVLMVGRGLISTIAYEHYSYASRTGGGPLVPLVYTPGEVLYLSRRGYWTNEDEMILAADPNAPAFFTGFVAQRPRANNQYRLGIQTSM